MAKRERAYIAWQCAPQWATRGRVGCDATHRGRAGRLQCSRSSTQACATLPEAPARIPPEASVLHNGDHPSLNRVPAAHATARKGALLDRGSPVSPARRRATAASAQAARTVASVGATAAPHPPTDGNRSSPAEPHERQPACWPAWALPAERAQKQILEGCTMCADMPRGSAQGVFSMPSAAHCLQGPPTLLTNSSRPNKLERGPRRRPRHLRCPRRDGVLQGTSLPDTPRCDAAGLLKLFYRVILQRALHIFEYCHILNMAPRRHDTKKGSAALGWIQVLEKRLSTPTIRVDLGWCLPTTL